MAQSASSGIGCLVSHSAPTVSRRMFASTPINAVLRCQEPFFMPKPDIDKRGRPRHLEATLDESETTRAQGRPEKHSDGWGASSRSGNAGGGSSRPFNRDGGFERREGPRPFGKKGGFGLKSQSDEGGYAAREESGRRGSFARGDSREEEPRQFERGKAGGMNSFSRDRPVQNKRLGSEEAGGRPMYGRDRTREEKPRWSEDARADTPYNNRKYDNGRNGHRASFARGTGAKPWDDRHTARDHVTRSGTQEGPWNPVKKLTFQAMAGLRALHANDPQKFDKDALSERFGVSYDAVSRILRSDYQDRKGAETGERIQGTKWDMNPSTSRLSPVPAVKRAFGRANGEAVGPGRRR